MPITYPKSQWALRESLLALAVICCASAELYTEILTSFGAINRLSIDGFWAAAVIFLAVYCFIKKDSLSFRPAAVVLAWPELVLLGAIIVIALLSAVVAFQCPPNTADSLVYHLPRVMFWVQNGSLAYYPTPVLRQLNYPPGAEILLLHVYFLTGDDRWFNFLQWFAMAGSVVAVSLLAKYLGASVRGQLLAALVAVTVPMGVLQSNSTQNDYVLTFWVICAVVFVWRYFLWQNKSSVVLVGLSVGLAFLTKGTALVVLPFLVFLLWVGSKRGWFNAVKMLGVLLLLLVILNIGYWSRNINGQPHHGIFPENETSLLVEKFWPQGMAANIVRHSALHLMTPFDGEIKLLHDFVFSFEDVLGVKHDDGRIFSYDPANAFTGHYVFNDDVASNALHFLFCLSMLVIAVFFWPKQQRQYAACVFAAWLLMYCLIKWQPWASRFHLPLFLLAAPIVGIGICKMRAWRWGVVVLFVIIAVGLLLTHNLRPLIGDPNIFSFKDRRMWYFAHVQDTTAAWGEASALIKSSGCKDIGLITGQGSFVYPVWPLIDDDRSVRFHYVDVDNFSGNLMNDSQNMCLVVTLDNHKPKGFVLDGSAYLGVWQNNIFQIYAKSSP